MPNPNYRAGVAFERKVKKEWESGGWYVTRAAGSHGAADLICLKPGELPVVIQCKRVETMTAARKLISRFTEHLPLPDSDTYRQHLSIYVVRARTQIGRWLDDK